VSVINRMLQELESRHEQPQAKLPGIVRAVPPERATYRRFLPLAVLSLGAAILGGLAFWAWQAYSVPPVVKVTPPPAAVPVAATPPEQSWPQPLQAPTETLVSELALASPPASQPAVTGNVLKAVPSSDANPRPFKKRESPRAVEPAQPEESLVLKSAPSAAPETPVAPGIKQVSPTQRADQSYREALLLRSQGRAAEAQSLLEDALKIHPRHLGARQALLGMLVDGKRYAQAETLLQDGLAQNIAPSALAMALARLQMERGDQNAALSTLERYASQAQDSADYQAFQAALLQRVERHAEAVAHYQAALRAQPNRAVWWMGLGISLQAEKRVADAAQAFNRARATPGLSPELQAFVEQRLKQLQ
jgi:MSHA biogenesis protein MshN